MQKKAVAVLRNANISPYKLRLVITLVRGKLVNECFDILSSTNKKASIIVAATLKSAMSNALHNYSMNPNALYVSDIRVDEGMKIKRYKPASRGSVRKLVSRRSHLTVTLALVQKTNTNTKKNKAQDQNKKGGN